MAQETKAKSEGDQMQRTIYGQNGQMRPARGQAQETADQPQGAPYDQSQTPPQRADGRPQRQGTPYSQNQVPPQRTGSGLQGQGTSYPRMQPTIYGQDGSQQMRRPDQRLSQGTERPLSGATSGQRPISRRTGSRPQGQSAGQDRQMAQGQDSTQMRPDQRQPQRTVRQPQRTANGQASAQRMAENRSQASSERAQGVGYGQDGSMQGRAPYGQNGQAQGRVPHGQSGPMQGRSPYSQNGQAQGRAPYSQAQGRPPYSQNGRGRNGQPYMQGTMVQRRDGRMPDQMMLSGRQLTERSRKMFRSPLFLVISVLCSIFAVTTIASVFLQELSFSQVVNILANFDAPSELMAYANRVLSFMSSIGNGVIIFSLIFHLPELLLCVGFWILFVTTETGRGSVPGTGFLCTKIYIIIKMVIMCIALLIGLIMSVVFTVSAWLSANLEAKIVSAVFLAAMIVVTMMIIMYYFCLLHTVKVCKVNVMQGEAFSSVSRYAAVLTILAAAASSIGWLSAVVNAEIAGIISFSCKIGWMVLAGLWIFLYRNKINGNAEEE